MKRQPILILMVMRCAMLLLFPSSHVVVGLLGTDAECRAADFLVKVGSLAHDISNDGSAVLWSRMVETRDGETWRIPNARVRSVDSSGGLVVGSVYFVLKDNHRLYQAVLWSQNGDVQLLGQLAEFEDSEAWGISSDGQTVVGNFSLSCVDRFNCGSRGFLWTDANGMRALPPTEGFNSSGAWGVSADGRVAVGGSSNQVEFQSRGAEGTIWVDHGDGEIETIGLGRPNGEDTGAVLVSDDGSVVTGIVGGAYGGAVAASRDSSTQIFRWTETEGMVPLGLLSGTVSNMPTGISGDGSVIVGNSEIFSGRMFVWDEQYGMRDLETVLIEEHGLEPDIFRDAIDPRVLTLSSDGTALGGSWTRPVTGWVAFLDRPLVVTTGVDGDFNGNATLDVTDLDLLAAELQSDRNVDLFDVNSDNMVDFEDRRFWVEELAQTFLGDANLDKEVNFADFLALSSGFDEEGGWAKGDFDGSGDVQFADFLLLSSNFGMSAGAAASVPEPSAKTLFLLAAGVLTLRTRNGWWAS